MVGAPVPPPGIPGPFALEDPDRLGRLLTGPLAKRLALLGDPARGELRDRLTEAVRPYRTPGGLDFPGVSLVAAGRRAAG